MKSKTICSFNFWEGLAITGILTYIVALIINMFLYFGIPAILYTKGTALKYWDAHPSMTATALRMCLEPLWMVLCNGTLWITLWILDGIIQYCWIKLRESRVFLAYQLRRTPQNVSTDTKR